ncbi:MAG: ABC transporter ATP-binding protein [Pyrinomonadaceae bacterium]
MLELAEQDDVVVSVTQLSKKFCRSLKRALYYGVQDIAAELLIKKGHHETLRTGEFWALRDVRFQLRRGEALGLIGPNGAGKSTLLRIITGLIKPNIGEVRVTGKVAPLIALGAGFNPVLTGRENIHVNLSILGLTKRQIEHTFEQVVEFAEIEDALDAPVLTYSSGMAARLGFACAIHTSPDVLLIDEVLAVGDMKFRAKCYRQLTRLRENGASFVLVSHNPNSVLSICNSAIYLSGGRIIADGPPDAVMTKYEEDLFTQGPEKIVGQLQLPEKPAQQSTGLDILALYFRDQAGNMLEAPSSGETVYFCVKCRARAEMSRVGVSVLIRELFGDGECVLNLSSEKDDCLLDLASGETELQLHMPYCGLKPGSYTMKVYVSKRPLHIYDAVESFRFTVKAIEGMSQCSFYQPRSWTAVRPKDEPLQLTEA